MKELALADRIAERPARDRCQPKDSLLALLEGLMRLCRVVRAKTGARAGLGDMRGIICRSEYAALCRERNKAAITTPSSTR
jgi:hypothetical protein